jgi:hypothetical protein
MTTPPQPATRNPLDMSPGAAANLLAEASRLAVEHVDTIAVAPVAPEDVDVEEVRCWLDDDDFGRATDAREVLADVAARLRQWGAHVVHRGNAWVSPVRLAGRPAVRICVTNHRTTADDADAMVRALAAARGAIDHG